MVGGGVADVLGRALLVFACERGERRRIRSWAVVRVSDWARCGSTTAWMSLFSRYDQRRATTLVAAATACFFVVFTTDR